jgi:uncharacterized protein
MIVRPFAAAAVLLGLLASPTFAASFDCSKAATPFERAICDTPALSAADELLAKAFATATGGLTKESVVAMRADQRNWLDYAQAVCTDDAKPLTSGSYDETASACMAEQFRSRSTTLEQSRMLGGHRFYLQSNYGALPDPNEADNPDSYWKVASHETVLPLLDADDPLAEGFNAYTLSLGEGLSDGDEGEFDASADSEVSMVVKEVAGTSRITLEVSSYWYGHGAAHGNWGVSYRHYYIPEAREVIAGDIFSGDDWASVLTDAAWEQLQAQHKEWLDVDSAGDIAEIVVDPTRWSFSDDYGLLIQFQPYEIAAYAYGAPTITIPWEKLDAIKAETQESVRFGY